MRRQEARKIRLMPTIIAEQMLWEGAWHALAQAGRLLRSASLLFDAGEDSSALALAMFGREELGRSRLLRKCADEVCAGKTFAPPDIRRLCEDHALKQAASALSVMVTAQGENNSLVKAVRSALSPDSAPEERKQATALIQAATDAKQQRQAHDRHDLRCDSLYVDLNDAGTDWNRPTDLDPQGALNQINSALSDYANECQRVTIKELSTPPQSGVFAAEMRDAHGKMKHPVDLPPLTWPTRQVVQQ
jgi:AbiV family abortive infection protein